MNSWVDISQAIGGLATAAGLIFVGIATFQTRKQTRLLQEQVGRAWIGTEPGGVTLDSWSPPGLVVSFKNFGNVPAKLSNWKSKLGDRNIVVVEESHVYELKRDVRESKAGKTLGQYVFPGNTAKITLLDVDGFAKIYGEDPNPNDAIIGVVIEYEDVNRLKAEYGFILRVIHRTRSEFVISKIYEWHV